MPDFAQPPYVSDTADFITVLGTVRPGTFLVVVMRWHDSLDSYIIGRCSHTLREDSAVLLARHWSQELKIEVR